jgi:hypothetical protein
MWYNLAAAQGYSKANEGLNILERDMSGEQVAKARELSRRPRDSVIPASGAGTDIKPSEEIERIQLQQLKITEDIIKDLLS